MHRPNDPVARRYTDVAQMRTQTAVGARLAREVDASVYLTPRDVSFAGKPRSNKISVFSATARRLDDGEFPTELTLLRGQVHPHRPIRELITLQRFGVHFDAVARTLRRHVATAADHHWIEEVLV